MSGGDLKSAFTGAFTAALFFGVGTYFEGLANAQCAGLSAPQFAGKVLAHGAVGGVSSKLQGGEFRDGFRAAAFTQAFAPMIDKVPGSDFGARATRITIAAIVGGTASELGGGKFENGAMTGAFSRAFNDESHWRQNVKETFAQMGRSALAMGKMAAGGLQIAAGAALSETVVGAPIGAAMALHGASNISGGMGDYLNNNFGGDRKWTFVEEAYIGMSEDYGKSAYLAVDTVLSGAGALRSVPVVIQPRFSNTVVGYGTTTAANVESRIPLANDFLQAVHGVVQQQ